MPVKSTVVDAPPLSVIVLIVPPADAESVSPILHQCKGLKVVKSPGTPLVPPEPPLVSPL